MRIAPFVLVLLAGCGAAVRDTKSPYEPAPSVAPAEAPPPSEPMPERPKALQKAAPRAPMTIAEARHYMVTLINLDRASFGLPPVELEEASATRAAQVHANDMAHRGYLGHWGTDGSVPEQRHTEAGGADMVLENASCFVDEKVRPLDPDPRIDPKNVEKAEEMFFHETPPHDGHRKNILKPFHKKVGIGIAQPMATPSEIPVPCFSQEFVDSYGTYSPIPRKMKVGEALHVEGVIRAPAVVGGVGLARVDAPKPIDVAEANRRRSYPVPAPYQMYWPPGYKTPIPLKVSGGKFAIDVPVSDAGRPGMYELSVWAKLPNTPDFVMVGLRTIQVQ